MVWPFAAIVAIGFITLAVAMLWCAIREFIIPREERAGYTPPPAPANFDELEDGDDQQKREEDPS